jgi:hypothetical protein
MRRLTRQRRAAMPPLPAAATLHAIFFFFFFHSLRRFRYDSSAFVTMIFASIRLIRPLFFTAFDAAIDA